MSNNKRFIRQAGNTLLNTPILNKGSAFTEEERKTFNLLGLLPHKIETIEEQLLRAHEQFIAMKSDIDKHIYLRNIQDTNETLYYQLLRQYTSEMMPIIYTPTVGEACQTFSQIYRRHRGLFLCYEDRDQIEEIINNAPNTNIKVIVVTDGERILGLGDQGIGGMGIPVGKLALYTACGGINPEYTLPVVIDVGTNNQALRADPMYMGWRHPRITGDDYYEFVDQCLQAMVHRWPNVLIQFEDFSQSHAMPLLEKYKDNLCCFNDDIQGTAAVTVGTLLSACKVTNKPLKECNVVFAGAGSAGCGIAEAIIAQMVSEGLSEEKARSQIFMVDRWGLLISGMANLHDFQQRLIQSDELYPEWNIEKGIEITLHDVVKNAMPDILIGVTGVSGLFDQALIEEMASHVERPIVMPLSNPTSRVEAIPANIIAWTHGKALVATGSPFEPVIYQQTAYPIAQCNNSYIFPGVGLGVLACEASRVTNEMLQVASAVLADYAAKNNSGGLLPPLDQVQELSKMIAEAVAMKAIEQGVAVARKSERIVTRIDELFWDAKYATYKRIAS